MTECGLLLINKNKGVISHDLVQRVRSLYPGTKVGHIGTLDPSATGLLPLMIGEVNRLHIYLAKGKKKYRSSICLGRETDTYDSEGEPAGPPGTVDFDKSRIQDVLTGFIGTIDQVPPPFSAVKIRGKPLHKYAREGKIMRAEPRKVQIYSLSLDSFTGNLIEITVVCSAGTYLRTLAYDIGRKLGCGAYLERLQRLSVGEFRLEDAVDYESLEFMGMNVFAEKYFRSSNFLLPHLHLLKISNPKDARHFSCGGRINIEGNFLEYPAEGACNFYQPEELPFLRIFYNDILIGIGISESGLWVRPKTVLKPRLDMF